jgi:hypothetical protein
MGPADQVHSAPSEPIFLQTKLAQGIAGVFVWAALFVTCTQVSPRPGADVGVGKTGKAVRWRTAGRTEVYYLKRFRDFLGGITRGDAAKWRFEKSDQIFCGSNFK